MYDHSRQFRCIIIRGKSKKKIDDMLPAYAKVINEVCPCRWDEFEDSFNARFSRFLTEAELSKSEEQTKKTFDNHRTEIAGKLFGMYYFSEDGMVYESERTTKFLVDNDQPAFFKNFCYKYQFPNGTNKPGPLTEMVENNICIRQYPFILKFLQIAKRANVEITANDIGYYILNSLDVLQGKANPYEVFDAVVEDKNAGIVRKIVAYDEEGKKKADSYTFQHIREQLNYLELANLIRITDGRHNRIVLNPLEKDTIDLFISKCGEKPDFDVYSYDLSNVESRKIFQLAWDAYYGKLADCADKFSTSIDALSYDENDGTQSERGTANSEDDRHQENVNTVEFGDEGEEKVYIYELNRVTKYNPRLARKVHPVGKTKGIGYDIQSVIAEPGDMEEFVKYIEVKSTKRYTKPDLDSDLWVDTLNLTRNEYVAAKQHGKFYSIYRVYFTRSGVYVFTLDNVAEKIDAETIQVVPLTYRLDFSENAVDKEFVLEE